MPASSLVLRDPITCSTLSLQTRCRIVHNKTAKVCRWTHHGERGACSLQRMWRSHFFEPHNLHPGWCAHIHRVRWQAFDESHRLGKRTLPFTSHCCIQETLHCGRPSCMVHGPAGFLDAAWPMDIATTGRRGRDRKVGTSRDYGLRCERTKERPFLYTSLQDKHEFPRGRVQFVGNKVLNTFLILFFLRSRDWFNPGRKCTALRQSDDHHSFALVCLVFPKER